MRRLEADIRFVYDKPWILTLKSYEWFHFPCDTVAIRERGDYCHLTFYNQSNLQNREATMFFGDVFVCNEKMVK